jgi:hypothetical protein
VGREVIFMDSSAATRCGPRTRARRPPWRRRNPDALLDELADDADPATIAERRESVALAFIAALQLLPPPNGRC